MKITQESLEVARKELETRKANYWIQVGIVSFIEAQLLEEDSGKKEESKDGNVQ